MRNNYRTFQKSLLSIETTLFGIHLAQSCWL